MQKLAEICIRRPVFALVLILALVVVGIAAYQKLGVDRYPPVDYPTIRVSARLPGASASEMESQVAQPIEEAINTVEGIEELRSICGAGVCYVMVTFKLERDTDSAAQDVRDRVAGVLPRLPREVDPPVVYKYDSDRSPVMSIGLYGPRPLRELSELADKVVKVQLERASGVGEIELAGDTRRAINVRVSAERLAAYQIPITEVRAALQRQNADVPGGNVTTRERELVLRTVGRVADAEVFNNLVIAQRGGAPVRIRDIGYAEDGTKEQRTTARLNGQSAVLLEVRRQTGANTVAVIEDIKKRLPAVTAQLPADVRLEILRDQSRYIYEALHEINLHLVLGSILASLVVFAFMRNWRATLIAAVAIPASTVATFGIMWALDFTLNSVTMLALVLMVGIVIDDAIVVLENIFRFIEEKKLDPFDAAREATREIGLAVLATTLSLAVIFIPVSFMSSISGRFLYQFGITAAVAVMVSLLVSFTLTPMMSARLFRKGDKLGDGADSRRGFYGWLDRWYEWILHWTMRHRVITGVLALAVMVSSVPLYQLVKQEFTPGDVDEGEFEVSVTAREGASVHAMDEAMKVVEEEILKVRGVSLVVSSIGGGGLLGQPNYGRIYVQLIPHEQRRFSWRRLLSLKPWQAFQGNFSQTDVLMDVRKRMRKFPDLRISARAGGGFSLGGASFEIDFSILGPDLETLGAYAEKLRVQAPKLGILDADTTLKLDKPELRVKIDRERAAELGVNVEDIATALRVMVGGDDRVSRFRDEAMNEDYDVELRLMERDRNDPADIARLYVPRQGGGLARVDNLVDIEPADTASRIDRLDRQRQVSVRAAVAPGFALADRLQALQKAADELNMPPAYTTRVSGRGRELERTFTEFLYAFALSVVFMYLILAAQYESFIHPFTILLSLPLALPFALFSLWASGNTLNLYSALGLLVLFGVVKKNAILQIDHMNQLRQKGLNRLDAIIQGNRDRLRPILMTTLSLVAGMIPLAVGNGPGAEERRAVAVVVIGGQSLCLLLTLVVTPVVYSWLDDAGALLKRGGVMAFGRKPAVPVDAPAAVMKRAD
jgi:HAE1 family hydrophobic/amphiphilic exporter-1